MLFQAVARRERHPALVRVAMILKALVERKAAAPRGARQGD
jgi:hypothetical protein